MKHRRLHPWTVSVKRAARIQESLREEFRRLTPFRPLTPALVAGADVSFDRGSSRIHGAVVVLTYPGLRIVEIAGATDRARFPYVPGYLSFREVPVLLKAFGKIRQRPDLLMCDGQGIAHPRRFGLACHLGMLLEIPSIGCAKSRLVGDHREPGRRRGARASLTHEGEKVGAVVRTRDDVSPIFVSPGYRVDTEDAVRLVLACCRRVRIPEPTRHAHLEVNRVRRESHREPSSAHPSGETRRSARGNRWSRSRVAAGSC